MRMRTEACIALRAWRQGKIGSTELKSHNFVRCHMALGMTPAEVAGIKLELGRNQWLELISLSIKIFILNLSPESETESLSAVLRSYPHNLSWAAVRLKLHSNALHSSSGNFAIPRLAESSCLRMKEGF